MACHSYYETKQIRHKQGPEKRLSAGCIIVDEWHGAKGTGRKLMTAMTRMKGVNTDTMIIAVSGTPRTKATSDLQATLPIKE